ncbi:hypothetical protein [Pararhizobium haloflavum]|uniref:hypothetical protein n=1 Tax=Pararhizobium haloflavum TaxID=2037914 RepID=UPI000C19A696|nr:hypothetical protein [Pararhizobium haloflavum]
MEMNGTELRISGVLGRLENVLANENALIGADVNFDIKASNARKSRCLYELNLLFKSTRPDEFPPAFRSRLEALRAMLDVNAVRVRAHLEAVRGVTDLLNDAVQAAEADGTYSMEQFRYGAHP